jgi:hypothetical protein
MNEGREVQMRILSVLLFLALLAATPAGPRAERDSAQAAEGAGQSETPPQTEGSSTAEEELEEFVPTEELSADSAISFPVDI